MSLNENWKKFNKSENFWIGLLRDFLSVVFIFAIISSFSYITLGRASPIVAVESESMYPHIHIGDIIITQSADRTQITTYEKGKGTGYTSFEEYGDVILYRKFGQEDSIPIIHRAMYYVEKGEPMWDGGPPAPHAGYITKGDNSKTNAAFDQQGSVSYNQPVKKEWVIAVARFYPVPLLGCVSLIPRGNFACLKES
ncbi:MAG: S26 family signal peptidase [Candidatus Methanoperedens sp.]|nr:S26 family signal peptidase [Candidatus Methanoperedens sp.]MCE8426892.1 S26 family signal peptidase [Candidatus Methanoperedens sp.]